MNTFELNIDEKLFKFTILDKTYHISTIYDDFTYDTSYDFNKLPKTDKESIIKFIEFEEPKIEYYVEYMLLKFPETFFSSAFDIRMHRETVDDVTLLKKHINKLERRLEKIEMPIKKDDRIIIFYDEKGDSNVVIPNPDIENFVKNYLLRDLPNFIKKVMKIVGNLSYNKSDEMTNHILNILDNIHRYERNDDLNEIVTAWTSSLRPKYRFYNLFSNSSLTLKTKCHKTITINLNCLILKYNVSVSFFVDDETKKTEVFQVNSSNYNYYGIKYYSSGDVADIMVELLQKNIYATLRQGNIYQPKWNGKHLSYLSEQVYYFIDRNGYPFTPEF